MGKEQPMTDFSVIAITATIITVGIVGVGIQVTLFLYLLRRVDGMQKEMSEGKQEVLQAVGAVSERVARLEGILIGRLEVGNGTITQAGDD